MAVLLITAPWAQNLKQKGYHNLCKLNIKKIKVESLWCVHVCVVPAELRRGCWIPGASCVSAWNKPWSSAKVVCALHRWAISSPSKMDFKCSPETAGILVFSYKEEQHHFHVHHSQWSAILLYYLKEYLPQNFLLAKTPHLVMTKTSLIINPWVMKKYWAK